MTRWATVEGEFARAGGNGLVTKVRDTSGAFSIVAAKKTLKTESFDRYDRFRREVRVARDFDHENIVQVLDAHLPPEATVEDPPFLIMPWYSGGTIHERLIAKAYQGEPVTALSTVLPLFRAVAHLHDRRKYHRDIKPRNILFDENDRLILCDFGLCLDLDEAHLTLTREVVGSLRYRAPEYLSGRLDLDDQGPGDVFALGKTLWAMLAAEDPPEGPIMPYPDQNLVHRIGSSMQDAQYLVQAMTRQDREQRPRIDEVIADVEVLLAPAPQPGARVRRETKTLLQAFAETDPQLAVRRQFEENETRNLVDVHNRLLEIRTAVEADEEVQELLAAYPDSSRTSSGPPREFVVSVGGPGDHHPGESQDLAASLGFILPPARAVTVTFSPSVALSARVPMVMAVWSLAAEGRRVRVFSYVYTRGIPGRVRGFAPIHFPTTLDSASLRQSLLGLVPRQLAVLSETIEAVILEARDAATTRRS